MICKGTPSRILNDRKRSQDRFQDRGNCSAFAGRGLFEPFRRYSVGLGRFCYSGSASPKLSFTPLGDDTALTMEEGCNLAPLLVTRCNAVCAVVCLTFDGDHALIQGAG
ncbi:hypothetical protein LIA77_07635 [Sarocladium implicatum]|nr:hypothetical protein LIA77_07635 [Sarocladium implicatum]